MSADIDIRELGKKSRQSALVSLIGIGVLFGSLVYSGWHLRTTESQIQTLKLQADVLTRENLAKTADNQALQVQASELQNPINTLKTEYNTLKTNVEHLNVITKTENSSSSVTLGVTGENQIFEIRATANALGRKIAQGPLYNFSLFVSASPDVIKSISKVTYGFYHPTFRQQVQETTDGLKNFTISYIGWGCLDDVVITVFFKDGTTRKSDFDMCKKLGWG
jgi:hypothetical protein